VYKPLYPLWRCVYPNRYFEVSGTIQLDALEGLLELPMPFAVYLLEVDIFDDNTPLRAPCDSHKREHVECLIHAWHRTSSFDDYRPDADGSPFSAEPHTMVISWATNTKKTLYWRAGGFK